MEDGKWVGGNGVEKDSKEGDFNLMSSILSVRSAAKMTNAFICKVWMYAKEYVLFFWGSVKKMYGNYIFPGNLKELPVN